MKPSMWRVLRVAVRLPALGVLALLRFYQRWISPMRPPTCKYYPSCSQYAMIAIGRHGLLRGTVLATWRLLRCNPWSRGGVDDVPEVSAARAHRHSSAAATAH